MTEHISLIVKKLDHLARMREHLLYSMSQVTALLTIKNWQELEPDQHETLAAFRVRELRNAVNHEYEEDTNVLHEFFAQMIHAAPELLRCHEQLTLFCQSTYLQKP